MMASISSIIFSLFVYGSIENSILAKHLTPIKTYNFETTDQPISFKAYVLKYNKHYNSQNEYHKRQAIFEANVQDMIAHNRKHDKGKISHRRGINQFTDLTTEEFQNRNHGTYFISSYYFIFIYILTNNLSL